MLSTTTKDRVISFLLKGSRGQTFSVAQVVKSAHAPRKTVLRYLSSLRNTGAIVDAGENSRGAPIFRVKKSVMRKVAAFPLTHMSNVDLFLAVAA